MKFSIETVSQITGLPASSLRNWEKRFGFPRPERTAGGHRFYSQQDIHFLKNTVRRLADGQSLCEISALYSKSSKNPSRSIVANLPPEISDDVSFRVELIYNSLLNFDTTSILQHYALLNARLSPEMLFDRVFETILRRLGEDWRLEKVSIAQEHFASAFIRLKLASLLAMDFPSTQSQKILAAATSGEHHEGGLMLVAAHIKFRGFPVYYFGTDLPLSQIIKVCKQLKPAVLCLSYNCPEQIKKDLPTLSAVPAIVCIGGMGTCSESLGNPTLPKNVKLCRQHVGSEVASYIELLAKAKLSKEVSKKLSKKLI